MKTKILLLLAVSFSLVATAQKDGKYIFSKSGHIEYQLSGNTVGKKTVWYDEFGIKMATLTESTTTIKVLGISSKTTTKELEIRNGNLLWKINLLDNTGTKTTINYAIKAGKALTDKKTDEELHNMERQTILDMNGKIEGYENILGKKCLVFTLGTTKFWQYKGYPLKSVITLGTLTNNETAVLFEENIAVPAAKFSIPAGVKITEGVNPLDGGIEGMLSQMGAGAENEQGNNDAEEGDEPLQTNISYENYVKAVNAVKIPNFVRTASSNETSTYVTMFRINNTFGSISIMNPELYDRAEEGEGVEIKKVYTVNGKAAKYAIIKSEDTPMHTVFIKYPARKMTLLISSMQTLPLTTMEEIARQLNF